MLRNLLLKSYGFDVLNSKHSAYYVLTEI